MTIFHRSYILHYEKAWNTNRHFCIYVILLISKRFNNIFGLRCWGVTTLREASGLSKFIYWINLLHKRNYLKIWSLNAVIDCRPSSNKKKLEKLKIKSIKQPWLPTINTSVIENLKIRKYLQSHTTSLYLKPIFVLVWFCRV